MKSNIIDEVNMEELEKKAFFDSFEHNRRPFRILLGFYKGNYGRLLLSIFFHIWQNSPCYVLPIVTANIINIAANSDTHDLSEIWINAAVLGVLVVLNILFCHGSTKNRSIANRRVEAGLRCSIARKLQQLSITFYKGMESGRMQAKIMRDVENIEALATSLVCNMVGIVFGIGSAIAVTITKNITVFLFFLVTVPIAVFLMCTFRGKLARKNQNYRHEVENANASVNEMIELLPVTKAHALQETALSRFNKKLFKVADRGYELDITNAWFGATYWVVFQLFSLASLAFSGYLAYTGNIEIGDIALYQTYFNEIVSSISAIISLLPTISKGFDSVKSIGDIMWAMDVEDNKNKKKLKTVQGSFSFQNVEFSYPDDQHPILRGFNLDVQAGETIALVGESGSGKSTLLNMLIGFYRPSKGKIILDGIDMNDVDLNSYRSHIATVPQASVLFAGSIRDNITYGLEHITEEDVKRAIQVANLEEVIAHLPNGLDTNVGEHGDKLSGGQKQRISIARAVIRDPAIIIFDEATSALDTVSEKLIQESLDKLSVGRTTFIVAHRLSTIRNADKIAVVKDGICEEFGTFDELMEKKGEFYRFKTLQS